MTKVAVIQATPVLFDLERTLAKTHSLIREAAAAGAQVVLFPEAWLCGYPRGIRFGTVVGSRSEPGRDQWLHYWNTAVEVPGKTTEDLSEMAREANILLAIGITEKEPVSKSLYCSLLFYGPDGELLGKHQKLKPTGAERIIWAEGNGSSLCTFRSPFGIIGGLICWENYMPLARTALYQKGVEIYLAPTADSRDTWQSTLIHIACEGRCYVLGCNQFVRRRDYPPEFQEEIAGNAEIMCRGGSAIIDPLGRVLAGPLYDQEGILYAELDLQQVVKAKLDFDPVGHYSRPDVFKLTIQGMPATRSMPGIRKNH